MTKYIALGVAALFIVLDQWIKVWAHESLSQIPVISGVFYLTYLENSGAAFGIFQGRAFALALASLVVLGAIFVMLLSGRIKDRALIWGFSLIFSGGVGNAIDRLTRGFVVDYLDFSALFGFPIFNFADCLVVVGTLLVVVYILFLEKKKPVTPVEES